MRLPADHPNFRELIVDADGNQTCKGELIRFRTLTGICNDIRNPAMGSIGQLFARQVEFEFTFPDLERDSYSKNRHGGRLSLMKTDPQVISRKLTPATKKGRRIATKVTAFQVQAVVIARTGGAPFFNVLAAFWIQFMIHDWFSHLEEPRNDKSNTMTNLGCA